MENPNKTSSGVQELIDRLRDEGVSEGEQQAQEILQKANDEADKILNEARQEAEKIRSTVIEEIDAQQTAAHEALRLAFRDTELKLKQEMVAQFSAQVKRIVSLELQDEKFIKQIILTLAGQAQSVYDTKTPLEILLSPQLFEGKGEQSEEEKNIHDKFEHFIRAVSGEMLREGIELKLAHEVVRSISLALEPVGSTEPVRSDQRNVADRPVSNPLYQGLACRRMTTLKAGCNFDVIPARLLGGSKESVQASRIGCKRFLHEDIDALADRMFDMDRSNVGPGRA